MVRRLLVLLGRRLLGHRRRRIGASVAPRRGGHRGRRRVIVAHVRRPSRVFVVWRNGRCRVRRRRMRARGRQAVWRRAAGRVRTPRMRQVVLVGLSLHASRVSRRKGVEGRVRGGGRGRVSVVVLHRRVRRVLVMMSSLVGVLLMLGRVRRVMGLGRTRRIRRRRLLLLLRVVRRDRRRGVVRLMSLVRRRRMEGR